MAIFSTLKEKILSFLTQSGIRKVDFFEATGIQPSNFKGANVKSAPGGDMLVKVLTTYPQLSAEWLMRGEGDMIRNAASIPEELTKSDPTTGENYIPPTAPIGIADNHISKKEEALPPSALIELVSTIREQAEEIGRLKARIDELERERVELPRSAPQGVRSVKRETVET